MKRSLALVVAAFLLFSCLPHDAEAQIRTRVNAAAIYESYSFDDGLGYSSLSEFSIPIVVDVELGSRTSVVLSSGFASVGASGQGGNDDITVSGVLDTEARVTFEVVPRRVSFVFSGVVPTGVTEVAFGGGPILGLIAAETMDFSIVRLGSGGGFGGGIVAAVPVGSFALGLAGTFNQEQAYTPVQDGAAYQPGSEFRFRAGVEGPLARTTYLRVAGVVSRRAEDEFDGTPQAEPGLQTSLYATLEQGLGGSTLAVYAFGSSRSAPTVEQSAVGLAVLPESRTLVLGGRWGISVRDSDVFTPRVEYRISDAAALETGGGTPESGDFERLGSSFRIGADYRLRMSPRGSLVFQADGLTGEVRGVDADVMPGVSGFRGGVRLEWRP